MLEGTPEYNPTSPKPVNNEIDKQSEPPKRKLRDLIPQRLKGLFQRKLPVVEQQIITPLVESSSAPVQEQVPPPTVETVTPKVTAIEKSSIFPESFGQPDVRQTIAVPLAGQEKQQALETKLSPSQAVVPEGETSPIHPDIEEGARYVLEKKLVDSVRIGNTAGIKYSIRELGDAWKQAQKAANGSFELTPEGRKAIPERVRGICAQHMQEGLAEIYKVAEFGIQEGWEHSIAGEPERVAELYQIADEFQIPLTYVPSQGEASAGSNAPAVLITTSEQAIAYMQEVIDRNLPRGIHGILKQLSYQVGEGLLKQLPDYEQKIERWVDVMQKRGWIVTDEPTTPVIGEEKLGLFTRQVNRAEIRHLIDQAVSDNLAKGARRISEMVGFQVKSGWLDPLSTWGTPENIALYAEAGKRYGLTHKEGVTVENSTVNADKYFDPAELPARIREAVIQNFPAGLEAIQNRHLSNIRSGDTSQIDYIEKTLEQYIGMAGEYGITVNPDKLRDAMTSHITPDNLQQGVAERLNEVKVDLKKADYLAVSVHSREAEELRRFVHDRGFDGKVDFSELDRYLQETATGTPQLTTGTDNKTFT